MRSHLLEASTPRLYIRAVFAVLAVTVLALAALLLAKPAQAATFAVTKTADTNDGTCDADCSLREAIIAANSNPGADTIDVPAGTYTLTIAGRNENAAATGDLDITDELTITGAGAQSTTVDAGGIDRVFDDHSPPATKFTISGVTIRGGDLSGGASNEGGGVNLNIANLTLNDAVVTGNKSTGFGGGLFVGNGGSFVGNSRSTATLNNVTINNNTANFSGGGIYDQGTLRVTNSTVSNNTAAGFDGGASPTRAVP